MFIKNRNLLRWLIIFASFIIISLILWNTYTFFQTFKAEERAKMQNWSFAQKEIIRTDNLNDNISDLPLTIQQSNKTTPMILTDKDDNISGSLNIDEKLMNDSVYVKKLLNKFKTENEPIIIKSEGRILSKMYYGNSPLLNKLKYYPLALLLIIILFGAVVYFFYRSSKIATQNKLWSGMAKETAHQIGTPLSSLMGWAEILKGENTNPEYIVEIEKDIHRLETITERFSKIGSLPKLEKKDIVKETIDSYAYLKTRTSKLIDFEINVPEKPIFVSLNKQLYSWTIENLVKNAIDAMKGKGKLIVTVKQNATNVTITVSDTGKGLNKKQFKSIFEPGFTTKKRGWGLGLSLARRIIEDFHNGKIKVLESEINKGTSMQISLKTI